MTATPSIDLNKLRKELHDAYGLIEFAVPIVLSLLKRGGEVPLEEQRWFWYYFEKLSARFDVDELLGDDPIIVFDHEGAFIARKEQLMQLACEMKRNDSDIAS